MVRLGPSKRPLGSEEHRGNCSNRSGCTPGWEAPPIKTREEFLAAGRHSKSHPPLGCEASFAALSFAEASLSDIAVIAAYAVFLASYLVFALGKFPGMKIDRPGMAIIGAVLRVAFAVLRPTAATFPFLKT